MEKEEKGITAKKEDDMPEWYEQVCLKSELAEFSTVKGCMVIRPNGYAIWQAIQDYFDKNINEKMGVRNAYFPLFIPESFFKIGDGILPILFPGSCITYWKYPLS